MQKKIITFLTILLLGACSFFLHTRKKRESTTFVIGTAAGYAPFVSINEQGEYEGFDIDVARAIAKEMKKELVIRDYGSMASLFMAVDQGMVDALMWGLSITQERLEGFAMIHYQGNSIETYPLIFWNHIPDNVHSLKDMAGKKICVEPASSQYSILQDYPSIEPVATEKVDDALLVLMYGKADAALVEGAIAKKFQKLHPEIKIRNVSIPLKFYEQGCGIVVKKDNKTMIESIKEAVSSLKKNGEIARLSTAWGME